MVRHFGVFKFKENIQVDEIAECFLRLKSMVGRIEGLMDMEYGSYQSDEGLNQGFTHGFIMTFMSAAARDAYLPHPIHVEVRDYVVPMLDQVMVFDFIVS